jgi:hypothetical protein
VTDKEFNPARGEAPLNVAGKSFVMRYSFGAMASLQARIGKERFARLLANQEDFADFELLGELLAAGLRYHHRDEDVPALMDEIGLGELPAVTAAIVEAFSAAFPAAKEGGDAGPTTPTAKPPKA